ncbi:MAG: ABC transporter permease [Saprospiraceae bacterium]|nr:ABC transporter permease [Saprospiraceae bacterium]
MSVDSTFLEMFDFPMLGGDRTTALDEPFSIVINEDIAKKFFGDQNPIGQSLKWGPIFIKLQVL